MEYFLHEQFKQLQMLEDGSCPGFLSEVITLFREVAERILSQISVLL
jgi:hypothetical protein